MPIPNLPRSVPTLKRFLFAAYNELNLIEGRIKPFYWEEPLTYLEGAVILLEDRRYFRHAGIDLKSSIRELWKMVTFRRFGGSSTIEMQFVRTFTGYKERTFARKLYEMFLAWALGHRAGKHQILKAYLEVAYFGSGLTGAEQAASRIFGKSAWHLSIEENYNLASMLVYPRPKNPTDKWQKKIDRRSSYGINLLKKIGESALK